MTIKSIQLIPGYILSSLAVKLNTDFDFELLMENRQAFWKGQSIPHEVIRKVTASTIKYRDLQISELHDDIASTIDQMPRSESAFK